eukprot:968791_1
MACACPCFGDEADAEEKPNQMIQLDGLGMLRLDTQHVGQGSQGARSAKWFYFGETDNRLAVVNMLLCITCFLMWILFISAASPYIWGANPSDTTNDRVKPNLAQLQQQHNDLVAKHQTMKKRIASYEEAEKSKEGKEENDTATEIKRLEEDHAEKLLDAHNMNQRLITQKTGLEGQLKTVKQKFTTSTAVLENLKGEHKAEIDVAQNNIESLKNELGTTKVLLNDYRRGELLSFLAHFNSNNPKRGSDKEDIERIERNRYNNRSDPVAYKKWLAEAQPGEYNDWLARIAATESKDDEDSNGINEFAANNTNDDANKKEGTNDGNQ